MDKVYTLEARETENGMSIKAQSDGFTPIELYGILAWKMDDIRDQMAGRIKPTVVSRTCIKDEPADEVTQ